MLDSEVSIVLARNEEGQVACFPMAENSHRHGILDVSVVPAPVPEDLHAEARAIASGIAAHMDYVGTMAVEFFVVDGHLVVNEMAPRPHNSGHYTLDACAVSQYEQQVRALCGLPLGDGRADRAAVMVNLLGDLWYLRDPHHAHEPDWSRLLANPDLRLHLYGKHHPRPGRKMGHFTAVGADLDAVADAALAARQAVGIGEPVAHPPVRRG